MLSEKTYKANYRLSEFGDFKYEAKPVKLCKTVDLFREYFELRDMFKNGVGDDDAIEKRMMQIDKELIRRRIERIAREVEE